MVDDDRDYIKTFTGFLGGTGFLPPQVQPQTTSAINAFCQDIQTDSDAVSADNAVFHDTLFNLNRIQAKMEQVADLIFNRLAADYALADPKAATNASFVTALHAFTNVFVAMAHNDAGKRDAADYWSSTQLDQLNQAWANTISPVVALAPVSLLNMQTIRSFFERSLKPVKVDNPLPFRLNDRGPDMPVKQAIALTRQRFWFFSILQMVILTLLIGLVAYNTYGGSFVGDFKDFTAIFLVSFSLDISVESVSQMRVNPS